MMTVSVIYDPSPEAEERLARMLGRGNVHVTVWGAPDDYRLPTPIPPDDNEVDNADSAA